MTESTFRAVLLVIAAYQAVFGLLALFAPGTFFDEIGRYGAENGHYVGDVGAFYLAAAFGVGVAAVRPQWRVPILLVGAVWYGVHALNHLFDVGEASSDTRGWTDTLLLALGAAGSVWLAGVAARLEREGSRRATG
ncbi:MAG TPA: hypothetical protein VKA89_02795 [Solirubrobacterales bacterium]|nr:hypothetical protein [Solirubrobacterales bacterium]